MSAENGNGQETTIEEKIGSASGPRISSFESGAHVAPIIPRTLGELAMVASAVISAGLAPDSYVDDDRAKTEEQRADSTKARIMIGIMKGAEVGLPPISALSTIAIINNRPCIWGDGAMAIIHRSGLLDRIEEFWEGGEEQTSGPQEMSDGQLDHAPRISDFPDTLTYVFRIWRRGHEEPFEGRFSVRDAKRAGLWGNSKRAPWLHYPKRMLKNRARAFPLRDGFADLLMGLSIGEEIQDLPSGPPPKVDDSFLEDAPVTGGQRAIAAPTEQAMGENPIPPETPAAVRTAPQAVSGATVAVESEAAATPAPPAREADDPSHTVAETSGATSAGVSSGPSSTPGNSR